MKTQHYEPLIQEEQKPMEIRGFPVLISGTYVLLDDVVTALRAYAQSLSEPMEGAAVHEAATWLQGERHVTEIRDVTPPSQPQDMSVYGAEDDDVTPGVGRIEIFPDPPGDPHPKWYARSVDTAGLILKTTGGSFDQEFVIRNAQERWPGIETYLLKNSGEDSKWVEDQHRGVFPSLGPSTRRLWGGLPADSRDEGRVHSRLGEPQA